MIVPELNQYSAPFSVSIIATDGELEASQSFFVEILPVNDAPNAYSASETVDEDNSVAIILNADDLMMRARLADGQRRWSVASRVSQMCKEQGRQQIVKDL